MLGRVSQGAIIHHLRCTFLVGVILSICGGAFLSVPSAFAKTGSSSNRMVACPGPASPTNQSLLIVLLDRSYSLTFQPGATDPQLYSTSVTKALAELWPGDMAVIPFSNNSTPILGPATLSDLQQQADLKNKVEQYPIGGNTPLEPAMQQALDLLRQRNNPVGSRVIVITDGNPTGDGNNDGVHQEQAIRGKLIPQYCQQGIPVSAFGLTIDPNSSDGKDANKLLSDIAAGTGTFYTNVKGPEDLAREVISLYAQWQGLTFTPVVQTQGGNYPITIDPFVSRVSVVTFRSDSRYTIKLLGPDQQVITQGIQISTDRHYTIDNLNVSGTTVAGTYTINTGGDPNVQVYALVNSPLKIQLVQPTSRTVAHDDQSVLIQAQYINDIGSVTPEQGAAQVTAKVTLLVNGQPVGPSTNTIVLSQQKNPQGALTPVFSGGTLIYHQPGELQIEIRGTYHGAQRQASFRLPLLTPVIPIPPPKPVDYTLPIIIFLVAIVLLGLIALIAAFLLRRKREQPKPYGYITNGRRNGDVALDRFSKPVISSHDIQTRGVFNFSASFELVFTKDSTVRIRSGSPGVMVDVPGESKPEEVTSTGVELKPSRKIYTNGYKAASFETSPGRLWS
jgi:hypothetical protein